MSSNSSSHKESPLSSSTTPPTQTHCWAPQLVPLPTSHQAHIPLFFQTHALSSCLSHLRPGPQKRPPLLAPHVPASQFLSLCVCCKYAIFVYTFYIHIFKKMLATVYTQYHFHQFQMSSKVARKPCPLQSGPHRPQHPPGLIPRYPDIIDYIHHAAIHTHRFRISLCEDLLKLPCFLSHPPSKAFDVSPLPT